MCYVYSRSFFAFLRGVEGAAPYGYTLCNIAESFFAYFLFKESTVFGSFLFSKRQEFFFGYFLFSKKKVTKRKWVDFFGQA